MREVLDKVKMTGTRKDEDEWWRDLRRREIENVRFRGDDKYGCRYGRSREIKRALNERVVIPTVVNGCET